MLCRIIKINPQLAGILKTKENQETLTMEDGINKFIGKMTHTHGVTVGGTTSFFTGKLEPIEITVTTRTNNKKVIKKYFFSKDFIFYFKKEN